MKYALALEGGGAKGAYQMGVVKALMEAGYEFDAVVGTSIGALNAAMIAQGKWEQGYQLWKNISFSQIFDVEDEKLNQIFDVNISLGLLKYMTKKVKESFQNKGIDTTKIRAFIEKNVDEETLRKSNINFGLVTVCLSDKKPEELFLNQIKEGSVIDYLMATSNLPVFKRATVEDKRFLDGGAYDNCPVNMLEKKGYKNIIVIRLHKRNNIRNYKKIIQKKDVSLIEICPSDVLPNVLNFSNEASNKMLELRIL